MLMLAVNSRAEYPHCRGRAARRRAASSAGGRRAASTLRVKLHQGSRIVVDMTLLQAKKLLKQSRRNKP